MRAKTGPPGCAGGHDASRMTKRRSIDSAILRLARALGREAARRDHAVESIESTESMKKQKPKGKAVKDRGYTDDDLASVESPEITAEQFARMRPANEVVPHIVEHYRKGLKKNPTR
jgi:hypothetical protein